MGYNFDEHWALVKEPDITMTVRGKEYVLPPSPPVSYFLMVAQGDKKVADVNFTVLAHLFGQETVEAWVDTGMCTTEFSGLIDYVFSSYYKTNDSADTEADGDDDPKD